MTRQINIGGRQGRGDPETRPAPLPCNRLADDGRLIDPDSDWQDSAQALWYGGCELPDPLPEQLVEPATWVDRLLLAAAGAVSAGCMLALGWHLWSQP